MKCQCWQPIKRTSATAWQQLLPVCLCLTAPLSSSPLCLPFSQPVNICLGLSPGNDAMTPLPIVICQLWVSWTNLCPVTLLLPHSCLFSVPFTTLAPLYCSMLTVIDTKCQPRQPFVVKYWASFPWRGQQLWLVGRSVRAFK